MRIAIVVAAGMFLFSACTSGSRGVRSKTAAGGGESNEGYDPAMGPPSWLTPAGSAKKPGFLRNEPALVARLVDRIKQDEPAKQKRKLVLQLASRKNPLAADALVSLLRLKTEPSLRILAAEEVSRLGAGWAITPLRTLLKARSWKVRRAARRALSRLCPTPRARTRYYLFFGDLRDDTPKQLQTGRSLTMHMSRKLALRKDAIMRWPGCPGKLPDRLTGYELQPRITLTNGKASHTLKTTVAVILTSRQALKGSFTAKATFQADVTLHVVSYMVSALTTSLKQDLDRFLDGHGRRGT